MTSDVLYTVTLGDHSLTELYNDKALGPVFCFVFMFIDLLVGTVKPTGFMANSVFVLLFEKDLDLAVECVFEACERFVANTLKRGKAHQELLVRCEQTDAHRRA